MPKNSNDKIDKFSTATIQSIDGKLLDLSKPKVMGIINLTPDSFYQGSRHQNEKELLLKAEKHILEGASILDLGAISTRPGAEELSQEEELLRILPAVKLLRKTFPKIWISVDTWRSKIAKACIEEGADMVNDISGGSFDDNMCKIIGEQNTPYVLMHIKGSPQNMQNNPEYENIVEEIKDFLGTQIKQFTDAGATQIILDPGFGFGKTLEHNYHLLKNLQQFTSLNRPILVGISRKSMIYKLLKTSPEEALNGSSILNTLAIQNGANILRVHDVKEAMETIKLVETYNAC